MYYKWRGKWAGPTGSAEIHRTMGVRHKNTIYGILEWSDMGAFLVVKYGRTTKGAISRVKFLCRPLGVTLAGREDMNMVFRGALVPCSVFEILGLKRIPDEFEVTSPFLLAEFPDS